MFSSRVVGGSQQEADGQVVGGGAVRWVLLNDGASTWPTGTTMRLVGGPLLLCPIIDVPAVAPGQTVEVELEAKEGEEVAEVFYSLVTQDGQPFGEIAHVKIAPRPQAPKPVAVVVSSPMDGHDGGLEALQGEVKEVEWLLANIGHVQWPEDAKATLIYNTPGFEHLPGQIEIPALEPGMTVHAGVSALMPEREGTWKAMWAVTSPTHPEFGDILVVEFAVGEFPFMDWMLADEAQADSMSESSSQAPQTESPAKKLSASVAMKRHELPGGNVHYPDGADTEELVNLGEVSNMPSGTAWIMELALTNDGAEPWPKDVELRCCFGSGFGCGVLPMIGEPVQVGETVLLQMGLQAPDAPGRSAWVLAQGAECFGPAMMLEVQ